MRLWPKDFDCVVNWTEEQLDMLQDSTLKESALDEYSDLLEIWGNWYAALSNYPETFEQNEYITN